MTVHNAVRLDEDGYIVEFSMFEEEIPDGWIDVGNQIVCWGQFKKRLVNGIVTDVEPIHERTYHAYRAQNYPPVGDQLDAIWKALSKLTGDPDAQAMLTRIREVKTAHPKPTNTQ